MLNVAPRAYLVNPCGTTLSPRLGSSQFVSRQWVAQHRSLEASNLPAVVRFPSRGVAWTTLRFLSIRSSLPLYILQDSSAAAAVRKLSLRKRVGIIRKASC